MNDIKPEKVVLKNTVYIAAVTLILSVLMQAIFLIVGFWDITVLWGNLYGAVLAIGNFFLMGLTVQKAVTKEEKQAKTVMRLSQMGRLFGMLLLIVAAVVVDKSVKQVEIFNLLSLVIPLLFPRVAIMLYPVFRRKEEKSE